jgi:pimeloyl-ACP methyl ester carboxylesterase
MAVWNQFCSAKLAESERSLLVCSLTQFTTEQAVFSNGNSLHFTRAGDPSKTPLILLHGYCAGSAVFYKILGDLAAHFNVYCVDLLGMGRSSRPQFVFSSREAAEDFFVSAIEELRVYLGFTSFHIAGHSFGGYVSGCYALKYQQYLKGLVLISPAGMSEKPTSPTEKDRKDSFLFNFAKRTVDFFWKRNITPTAIMRMAGPLSTRAMRIYTRSRMQHLPEDELIALENYLIQINLAQGSGEYALSVLLEPGAWSQKPLWQRMVRLTVPLCILFGENDWIPTSGGHHLTENYLGPAFFSYVSKCSHQIHLENPTELATKMLHFYQSIGEDIDIELELSEC